MCHYKSIFNEVIKYGIIANKTYLRKSQCFPFKVILYSYLI